MAFDVKIILDSVAPCGKRLTTITATYPRFIHSEVMTHRDRARNAASSRAIPFPVMCERVVSEPVIPLEFPSEQKGMQGGESISGPYRKLAEKLWLNAGSSAVRFASALHDLGGTFQELADWHRDRDHNDLAGPYGLDFDTIDALLNEIDFWPKPCTVHKSLPNRIIEPWMWITVVMTATEWENFFRLRCHPDAEIHFQKIACMIREAMAQNIPFQVDAGYWHLPFIQPEEHELDLELKKKISVARCARVSYLTHDGKRDVDKDLDLFEKLVQGSGFGHWSPHEHVACACEARHRSGPFVGWTQYRKTFSGENAEG